jgi:hypothetical protein
VAGNQLRDLADVDLDLATSIDRTHGAHCISPRRRAARARSR